MDGGELVQFSLVMKACFIYSGLMGNIMLVGRLNPKCVKKSVKCGGGRVMLWGEFSAAGVSFVEVPWLICFKFCSSSVGISTATPSNAEQYDYIISEKIKCS